MDFSLTDEQELLQETVRGFVAKECPPQQVRADLRRRAPGGAARSGRVWSRSASPGSSCPSAHGGAGLELLELALVAEELGRGAVPVPFLGHALATLALAQGGSAAQQANWLPRLATGETRATVALAEPGGRWLPEAWSAELARRPPPRQQVVRAGGGGRGALRGRRGRRRARPGRGGPGVRVRAEPDARPRPPARARSRSTAPRPSRSPRGAPRASSTPRSVLLAADAFGAAHQLVRMTVAYVQDAPAVRPAARAVPGREAPAREHGARHRPDARALVVRGARATTTRRAERAARRGAREGARHRPRAAGRRATRSRRHGGIGFTWECDVQIWFKRVMFDRLWLGRARAAPRALRAARGLS